MQPFPRCNIKVPSVGKSFSPNSANIFLLDVSFENLTIRLHVLIISNILAKFQENQKSIVMSSIKCLHFKFL